MRVLIIEDEEKVASIVSRGLSYEGLAVDVATTVEQAMELGIAFPYDLVILDLLLPDGSGTTVLAEAIADHSKRRQCRTAGSSAQSHANPT